MIKHAGFFHSSEEKQFSYEYLSGTHLLQTLTKPNNMSLTLSYEDKRDLLTGMSYKRGNTGVASRTYTYDAAGRPITRNTARNGTTVNDSFGYNNRSELTAATVNNGAYSYNYDNIGNRNTAQEITEEITNYTANNLNQYTAIGDFAPTYDAAGNQTLVKTTTGIWTVAYDAENRPVSFTNAETNTVIECAYDHMGRRATKKVTANGVVTLHHRYLYRGFLQIACCDLTRSNHPALWLITWDPSQPIATRPLAIQKDGTWYTYGWDLTKNICEVYGINGYIRTNYTYTLYGAVTTSGDVTQPIQWSSEFHDDELALVYYNYRHYNPTDGRWLSRDSSLYNIMNLYAFMSNKYYMMDYLGNSELRLEYHIINEERDKNTIISKLISKAPINIEIDKPSNFNPNIFCAEEDCISHLTINAHGFFYDESDFSIIYAATKDEYIYNLIETVSKEKTEISDLINNANIKFCDNAILDLNICFIGLNKEIEKRIKEHYKDINLKIITHEVVVMPGGIENIPATWIHNIVKWVMRYRYNK